MRNAETWLANVLSELVLLEQVHGRLRMPKARFLNTELVLTLMHDYFPGQDPAVGWIVLNGHPFPALETLCADAKRAIAIARLRLPAPVGRGGWERALVQYQALPPPYPIYSCSPGGVAVQPTPVLRERLAVMREALRTTPEPARRLRRAAKDPGRYRFFVDRDVEEVEIPAAALHRDSWSTIQLDLRPRSSNRGSLSIPRGDLLATAEWMDRHSPAGPGTEKKWRQRMEGVEIAAVTRNGVSPESSLTLNGLLHLIGMVGSGKSTLLTVLTVYLALKGYRVALILGDVASLLREFAIFEDLRVADPQLLSVPLTGRTTRKTHLNRLHAIEARVLEPTLQAKHPAFPLFSTVCPLDGLRVDADPVPLGYEPCTRLYPRVDGVEAPGQRYDCPLMPDCPMHLPTRRMTNARIWLATPASLLASEPQVPLVPHAMRYAEWVMRCADVVLIDEADAVQVQFDDRFAPYEVLIGSHESWLDRLASQVARQVYQPTRPAIGRNPAFDRWHTAHDNTQRAVNRLYCWLRESGSTRKWLGTTYFSRERLLHRIEHQLRSLGAPIEPFRVAREALASLALGSVQGKSPGPFLPTAWNDAIRLELLAGDGESALQHLQAWLQSELPLPSDVSAPQVEELAHHLLIALLVGVLDNALRDVILEWSVAEEYLEIDRGTGGLFYNPSDEFVRLVPEPAMGAVQGFQYWDPDGRGNGELRFFRLRGIGRALLYHLHDALQSVEGVAGPHVLLTSGTSWAPGSWRYHLQVPPQAVLLPNRADRSAETTCRFEPLIDPDNPERHLFVSGQSDGQQRLRSLRAMVTVLTRPHGFGEASRSRLERELQELEDGRRRILLVVGSYEEARVVTARLAEALGTAPGEDVVALIPDTDGEDRATAAPDALLRSMLATFPERSARFLVAPLQAIERGHNVLVGYRAAIGSVYFLVRPYPRPGDLHAAIQRVNAWAMTFVPTLTQLDIAAAGRTLRLQAEAKWAEAIDGDRGYLSLSREERTSILWTQMVLVWQCIGRLLRGGTSAAVHFIDAKWAEVSAGNRPGEFDTEETSMLVGFRRILGEALAHPDPAQREIAQLLYGPFATALARVDGLHTSEGARDVSMDTADLGKGARND